MNKRVKKKHCMYGEVYLKSYDRQYGLPFAWFEMCKKIRNDLGHPIGRKRKPLERYFRRRYYWTESQCETFWPRFNYDIKMANNPFGLYNTMVNDMTSLQEKYEDAMILDYLEERGD